MSPSEPTVPECETPAWKFIHAIENAIITQVITDALGAGYSIQIDNGSSTWFPQADIDHILADLRSTEDGDILRFHKPGQWIGWVQLIYENDGWDVIADYTDNPATDALLANAEALADQYAQEENL